MRAALACVVLLGLTAACGGRAPDADPAARADVARGAAAECARIPEVADGRLTILWPGDKARDLVPSFDDACAVPTSPHLFTLLYEDAGWASELKAAALGVIYSDDALATFRVVRLAEDTPGLGKVAGSSGSVTTESGDLSISWGRAGDHIAAFWVDGSELVTLMGEGTERVVSAVQQWVGSNDIVAPKPIPEVGEIPRALDAGPPLQKIPAGYEVFGMDALAFMGSDFADAVTIHEEKNITALGAAVAVSDDGDLVGTIVAGRGYGEGLGRWPEQVKGVSSGGLGDVAAEGFTAGGVDALIVGYDREVVTDFASAWERSLSE